MADTSQPSTTTTTTTTTTPALDPASLTPLPRITIRFCTQCKWMLRAAYFAQELLSTFSTALGEVALQPSTGGTFVVDIFYAPPPSPASSTTTGSSPTIQQRTLWDRKTDGGFPETKELKRRVRDVIEPGRDLGHVDRDHPKPPAPPPATMAGTPPTQDVSDLTSLPPPTRKSDAAGAADDATLYKPRMPAGGVKPVVPPASAESNEKVRAQLEAARRAKEGESQEDAAGNAEGQDCEDCK